MLANESMPDLLKVGFSERDPDSRMQELYSTGVPTPFRKVYECLLDDPAQIEGDLFSELSSDRVEGREFFRCTLYDICNTLNGLLESRSKLKYFEWIDESFDPKMQEFSDWLNGPPSYLRNRDKD